MEMVNGYVFLDLTKANVYAKALKVLGTDKPVVIKDGSGAPYFVDSLTLDGTNVVITKGGKTITIANDNTITSEGTIQEIYSIKLGDLSGDADDIDSISNFDFAVITEELYNKLISGKALVTAKLYDSINFTGFLNWVSNGKTTTNVLVKTEKRFYYFDETDQAMCFVSIGQLEDNRYYLLCSSTTEDIINQ